MPPDDQPVDALTVDDRPPRFRRGRVRAVIGGVEIRNAPADATSGVGIIVGGERFDADDVIELRAELLLWLLEQHPERAREARARDA